MKVGPAPAGSHGPPGPSAQDRIWRHDSRHLPQDPASESLALRRQPTALVIAPADTASPQLLPKGAILLYQVVDHVLLATIDPASPGDEQKPQGQRIGRHPP